ncbi:PREDICTED: actin-related protein 7-like [Erythranthe guttata]|uniref:actin-related protein 7-like n=1 Tax=Erythranthe guttata TaxID=4155 RepID=UPI00064DC92A|nr:PREDICTED: actin-related protein 7-like [Erythranthe guttata]|eukprot:XP_012844301.1 PREDICTED: actin-related protein 7-like [Erythranthe guttata]
MQEHSTGQTTTSPPEHMPVEHDASPLVLCGVHHHPLICTTTHLCGLICTATHLCGLICTTTHLCGLIPRNIPSPSNHANQQPLPEGQLTFSTERGSKHNSYYPHHFRMRAIPRNTDSRITTHRLYSHHLLAPIRSRSLLENVTVDPVVRGFIRDWDAMEDLLRHVLYTGLGWEIGNEGQILFANPLATPKSIILLLIYICVEQAVREQLVQLMFEKFNISGFYASEQAVLSLYAVGRISGCTVDIGHGKLDIASVIEGAVQHISSRRFEVGGLDLTNLFAKELHKSNPLVNLSISDVEKLKERYACSAEDDAAYEKMQKACPEELHTLPDGQVIKIGRERYTVGEALFQPSILGLEAHGIVEQLVRCISTVSTENHRQLLENTILCGGTASMTGKVL